MPEALEHSISQIIQECERPWWHRTSTGVDGASAEWLAEWVHDYGLPVALKYFDPNRADSELSESSRVTYRRPSIL